MIITGAGPVDPAGNTSVMQISTVIARVRRVVDRADQLPADDLAAVDRPLARRDRSPRRCAARARHAPDDLALEVFDDLGPPPFHHASAVATFVPFFSLSGSGSTGYGFARASS